MSLKSTPLLAALAAGALLLTGCGAAEQQTKAASDEDRVMLTEANEAQTAQQDIEQAAKSVETFTAPAGSVKNIEQLEGKTVFFVPANNQVPLFKAVANSLEEALESVDVEIEVCDGKANPANMATCLQQAIDAKAGAIITGSIPRDLVPDAFESAQRAGVPVVNMMTASEGPGDPKQVAYVTPDFVGMQALSAKWVIADSGGGARVLYIQITDTSATNAWAEQGALATYKRSCPNCEVTVVKVNTGELDRLTGLVADELAKNPRIGYVQAEADVAVQPAVQALQAANATAVKVAGMDGTLANLQALKAGRFVHSEVGFNADALAWYAADQVLRLMAGQEAVTNIGFPYQRIFTPANVGELKLTPEAEKTGEWYGSTDYQMGFRALWGVRG